jgi:methyl-accepting chemotaxis protein
MDITWNITVNVPQLDTLNTLMEQLMDYTETIKNEMTRLAEGQERLAQGQLDQTTALAAQLEGIQQEIAQFNAEDITETQLQNLLAAVTSAADKAHQAADNAQQQVTQVQEHTEMIKGIVPDSPPPTP